MVRFGRTSANTKWVIQNLQIRVHLQSYFLSYISPSKPTPKLEVYYFLFFAENGAKSEEHGDNELSAHIHELVNSYKSLYTRRKRINPKRPRKRIIAPCSLMLLTSIIITTTISLHRNLLAAHRTHLHNTNKNILKKSTH